MVSSDGVINSTVRKGKGEVRKGEVLPRSDVRERGGEPEWSSSKQDE
jgi:hypothetical protein